MAGIISPYGGGSSTATQLADLTGTVNVGSAAAPSTGQVLLASSAYTATWGGVSVSNAAVGTLLDATGSISLGGAAAPGAAGSVLTISQVSAGGTLGIWSTTIGTVGSAGFAGNAGTASALTGTATYAAALLDASGTVNTNGAAAPGAAGSVLVSANGNGTAVWSATLGTVAAAANAGTATVAGNLSGGTMFPAYVAAAISSLTMGASVAVNAALANDFQLVLTGGTATLATPSNPVDPQIIRVRVIQGGSGTYPLAYSAAYNFGSAGTPALSLAAGDVDILGFQYVGTLAEWCYLGPALGF